MALHWMCLSRSTAPFNRSRKAFVIVVAAA